MSATLQVELFESYFQTPLDAESSAKPSCTVMHVPGRQHPVQILYASEPEHDYLDAALIAVLQIHFDEKPGDILVFLTGQEEIESLMALLQSRVKRFPPETQSLLITPIFAALPPDQQMQVFAPTPKGMRKVILATNIAESSITINGVRYVVDSGCVKVLKTTFSLYIHLLSSPLIYTIYHTHRPELFMDLQALKF